MVQVGKCLFTYSFVCSICQYLILLPLQLRLGLLEKISACTLQPILMKDFKLGTRNVANLQMGVLIADKIGKKGGQLLMTSL